MSPARVVAVAGAALAAGACLGGGYLAAGQAGVVVAGVIVAVAALLGVRAAAPAPFRRPARRRRAQVRDDGAGYPAYRRIVSELGWAGVSRRHYDHSARPMFARLLGAVLEERYRVDLATQPEEARRLFGENLYPLVDQAASRSQDDREPGVDLATLSRIVDRLEEL